MTNVAKILRDAIERLKREPGLSLVMAICQARELIEPENPWRDAPIVPGAAHAVRFLDQYMGLTNSQFCDWIATDHANEPESEVFAFLEDAAEVWEAQNPDP